LQLKFAVCLSILLLAFCVPWKSSALNTKSIKLLCYLMRIYSVNMHTYNHTQSDKERERVPCRKLFLLWWFCGMPHAFCWLRVSALLTADSTDCCLQLELDSLLLFTIVEVVAVTVVEAVLKLKSKRNMCLSASCSWIIPWGVIALNVFVWMRNVESVLRWLLWQLFKAMSSFNFNILLLRLLQLTSISFHYIVQSIIFK